MYVEKYMHICSVLALTYTATILLYLKHAMSSMHVLHYKHTHSNLLHSIPLVHVVCACQMNLYMYMYGSTYSVYSFKDGTSCTGGCEETLHVRTSLTQGKGTDQHGKEHLYEREEGRGREVRREWGTDQEREREGGRD